LDTVVYPADGDVVLDFVIQDALEGRHDLLSVVQGQP
jgi:hypothetical protein